MHFKIYLTYIEFACFLSVFSFLDGIGWCIFSIHSKKSLKHELLKIGIEMIVGGFCFAISALSSYANYNILQLISVLIGTSLGLFSGIGSYKLRYGYWEPFSNNRNNDYYKHLIYHYDFLEVLIITIALIISVIKIGHGIITGFPKVIWIIGSSIAYTRLLDPVAAEGIAATPKVRIIVLWISRILITLSFMLKIILRLWMQ